MINQNINDTIIGLAEHFMELLDKRLIKPQIFHIDQADNTVNILYMLRVYPNTKIKNNFHLIPCKNILQYEYIQKALQLF